MSTIDNLQDFQRLGLTQNTPTSSTETVGQTEFLELMLAQFENQDPFEPMENGEFLSQLAQFSTATGIEELQAAFADFSTTLTSDQALQAAGLVGNEVLVGSELVRQNGEASPIAGAVDLSRASGDVTVDVLDSAGQLVRRIELGTQAVGQADFRWDGRLENGDPAVAGVYQLSARVSRGGDVESVPTLIRARVDSVSLGAGASGVTINSDALGAFPFNSIRQIF
ncbi:MAG: flagellar hook assembly protein FlgD [Pseudomonadota bacterium]